MKGTPISLDPLNPISKSFIKNTGYVELVRAHQLAKSPESSSSQGFFQFGRMLAVVAIHPPIYLYAEASTFIR